MRSWLWGALAVTAAAAAATAEIAPEARRSGYDFAGPQTRAMQDDDTANPGMLWVLQGESLWLKKAGTADRSCADCHGDARTSMRAVAAMRHLTQTATAMEIKEIMAIQIRQLSMIDPAIQRFSQSQPCP